MTPLLILGASLLTGSIITYLIDSTIYEFHFFRRVYIKYKLRRILPVILEDCWSLDKISTDTITKSRNKGYQVYVSLIKDESVWTNGYIYIKKNGDILYTDFHQDRYEMMGNVCKKEFIGEINGPQLQFLQKVYETRGRMK